MLAQTLDVLAGRVATASNLAILSPLTAVDSVTGTRRLVMVTGDGRLISGNTRTTTTTTDSTTTVTTTTPGLTTSKTVINSTPTIEAAPIVSTTVLLPASVSSQVYLSTIEERRSDLEKLIALNAASSRLNGDQLAQLRAELDQIAQIQASYTTGGRPLTYVQAATIARSLDIVAARIGTIVGAPVAWTPIISGTNFVLVTGQIVRLDEIATRRADLEAHIADALATGKISASSAARLRGQLDDLAVQEQRFRADGMNYKESRILFTEFDRVGSRLDSYTAGRNPSF